MNIELKIYNGRDVVKTYTAETIDFSFGVIEDILNTIDVDSLNTGSNKEIGLLVVKCMKQLKPLLRDIFVGVTDEEIRNTHIQNLIEVFRGLINYATGELSAVAAETGKN